MVEQLWMWVLDGNTIITAFPERFGLDSDENSSEVHATIRRRLASPGTMITSIYDLAEIIIDECCNSLFNPTSLSQIHPEVLKIFSDSVATLVSFAPCLVLARVELLTWLKWDELSIQLTHFDTDCRARKDDSQRRS